MSEIRAGGHVIGAHGWEPALTVNEIRAKEYDPADHTVTEVTDYVGDGKTLAAQALAAEQAGKNRVSLIRLLEAILDGGEDE